MKWASAAAASPNLSDAIARAAADVRKVLPDAEPDCCMVFVSRHHELAFPHMAALLREHIPARAFFGCAANGVIGGGSEIEQAPAVSLAVARLPDVDLHISDVDTFALPDEDAPPDVWRAWMGLEKIEPALFIVLAHPSAGRLDALLAGLDYAFPAARTVGGIGGLGITHDEPVLFNGGSFRDRGAIVAAFGGNLSVDTVVAQGCRPIGRPLTVTRCERNVLLELDGEKPLHYLAELVESLPDEDRRLMRHSLFMGIRAEQSDAVGMGDGYLVRNLVGIDYARGVLAVGAALREGMVVHFHLRDRHASAEDLRQALAPYRATPPAGALLFSCLGRGRRLYQEPNHDSRVFCDILGAPPPVGCFCNGEIGPVGGATCVHGYTSSFALIRPARP